MTSRDASASEKNIDEYNSGVYCFNKDIIFKALESIGRNNAQGEYYLTDVVQYLVESGRGVECLATRDAAELLGINSMDDLAEAERIHRARREPDP